MCKYQLYKFREKFSLCMELALKFEIAFCDKLK